MKLRIGIVTGLFIVALLSTLLLAPVRSAVADIAVECIRFFNEYIIHVAAP